MPNFEYKVLSTMVPMTFPFIGEIDPMQIILNVAGANGWELVTVLRRGTGGYEYFFKRIDEDE